jgi:DNA-binding NarL/FixJ family response regulator
MRKAIASGKVQILVVDDHPLVREGLVQLLSRQPDISVCGEAECVASAEAAIARQIPHLILLDLRLASGDALDFIKSLRARYPEVIVLVISQHDEALFAERAIRAGASGYVMKQEATAEVIAAIRTVLAGDLYVSRKIAVLVFRKSLTANLEKQRGGIESLTDRELQVFQMLGAGMTSRKISEDLQVSIKTVETHRENIKQKLDLRGATALVQAATAWVQGKTLAGGGKLDSGR